MIWNTLTFSSLFQPFLSRIWCSSFFHWLWRFDSLNDIWCSNRESWLTIRRSDAYEFMGHPRRRKEINSGRSLECQSKASEFSKLEGKQDSPIRANGDLFSKAKVSTLCACWNHNKSRKPQERGRCMSLMTKRSSETREVETNSNYNRKRVPCVSTSKKHAAWERSSFDQIPSYGKIFFATPEVSYASSVAIKQWAKLMQLMQLIQTQAAFEFLASSGSVRLVLRNPISTNTWIE
jgi:hypothetical protein